MPSSSHDVYELVPLLGSVQVPEEFLCPITHELMRDPLMSRTGFTFERQAVLAWMVHHETISCPLTRTPLTTQDFVSNHALRIRIQQWCRDNNLPFNEADQEGEPCVEKLLVSCLPMTDRPLHPTTIAPPSTSHHGLLRLEPDQARNTTSSTAAAIFDSDGPCAVALRAATTSGGTQQETGPWSLVELLSK